MMRWSGETEAAARHLGWRVVKTEGIDDYQGWGVHLLQRREWEDEGAKLVYADALKLRDVARARLIRDTHSTVTWAVLSWSYGSCSGCDGYEDQVSYDSTDEQCAAVFGELIEVVGEDETRASELFSSRQGW